MRFGPFLVTETVTRIVTGIRSRRFSLVIMLLLAAVSRGGFALGLGEMQVTSVINEPLSATIPVLNADAVQQSELIVALGSASDYEATGVSWDFTHSELQFDVSTAANGSLVVNVTSSRPIREPYLNVLVQARWPAGRLLMEYTVLLDFPVFSGGGNSASASASSASTASSTISSVNEPAPQPVAAPRSAPAPAPEPVQAAPAPRLVSGAPTEQRIDTLATDEFRIQNGDTLWSLGGQVAQDLGVSRHQAMLAIREANPDAFIDGDINLLRSGSVVRVPPRNAAIARSEAQAAVDFAQAMSGAGRFADGTPLQSRVTDFRDEGGSDEPGTAQFRLTAGTQGEAAAAGSGVEALAEENQTLTDVNAALEEELAAAQITNRDLNERLQNLEEQIAVMEALIEVENNEIRAVQEAVTAVQPVVQPVTTAVVQEEPGILSKILSWLPLVGVVLVGLLVGAYLLIRKRKSEGGFDDTEYMEDAPVYEEDEAEEQAEEVTDESAESDDEAMPDLEADDLDDFIDLGDVSGDAETSEEQEESEQAADGEDMDLPDLEEEPAEPAEEESLEEDEDWGSDFDDLDSFFSGAEDEEGEAAEEVSDAADLEDAAEEAEEEESEKTQIFDAAAMAEMAAAERDDSPGEIDLSDKLETDSEDEVSLDEVPEEPEEPAESQDDEESILDFSLDEEDLGSEESEIEETADIGDSEDDEFSLDFDLDAGADVAEDSDSSVAEEGESSSDADEEDENTLAFDVSDMDLPDSDDSDEELEIDAEEEPEAEAEDSDSDDLDALLEGVDDLEDLSSEDVEEDSAEDLGEDLADAEADLDSLLDDLEDESSDGLDESEPELEAEDLDATIATDDLELPDLEEDAEEQAEQESEDDLLGDFDADLDDVDSEMSDAEEAETKLELAAAYIEMGDSTGAKELLEEVLRDGDDDSKEKAQGMLDNLS